MRKLGKPSVFLLLLVFFIINRSTFSAHVSAASFCKTVPSGQYCTDDLRGYYDCGATRSGGKRVTCSGKKECSCHMRRKCVVPCNEICQDHIEPLPIAQSFSTMSIGVDTQTSVNGKEATRMLTSVIYTNGRTGMFKRERWNDLTRNPKSLEFEILYRRADGKYNRFNGTIDKCEKSERDEIPIYGNPLKYHRLIESKIMPCGEIQDTWNYRIGPIRYNDTAYNTDFSVRRRKVNGKTVYLPYSASFETVNQDGSKSKRVWAYYFVQVFEYPDEFFQLPKHCKLQVRRTGSVGKYSGG